MLSELHRRCRRGKLMLFVGRCAITVLIALLPAATAFSQSDSVDRGISANDLARAALGHNFERTGAYDNALEIDDSITQRTPTFKRQSRLKFWAYLGKYRESGDSKWARKAAAEAQ